MQNPKTYDALPYSPSRFLSPIEYPLALGYPQISTKNHLVIPYILRILLHFFREEFGFPYLKYSDINPNPSLEKISPPSLL